ncbi:MAG: peptidase domain-containing ABC transporter, partial [Ramlibacter sp.]
MQLLAQPDTSTPTNERGEGSSIDATAVIAQLCKVYRVPFDALLLHQQFPLPHRVDAVVPALRQLGFQAGLVQCSAAQLRGRQMPIVACLVSGQFALVLEVTGTSVKLLTSAGETHTETAQAFAESFSGTAISVLPAAKAPADPDAAGQKQGFGFRWFVPELLKHKQVWRQVLMASLFLQLVSLAFPLVTQAVVDKVVVHRTQSTLIVLGIAMAIFVVFSALLGWVRQYLVLHTGNRVDAVLGASVFAHLLKLPVNYFERRPTGVIAARMHGIETIREFVSSAAVTLLLDVPFLAIGVAVMFFYSLTLTCIVLGILSAIGVMSFLVAPVLQRRMNEQFLLSARNQAFLTEHIAGHETVKSLQMEPMLNTRYGGYLASYLATGFATRQIGNTYNTLANALEQLMTVLVLIVGAWLVMNPAPGASVFTIGMLVAFQMFAGRISQPMLRLVGLWQQFQQASLAVQRLGDLMNAPPEPYALVPSRLAQSTGRIEFQDVGFRYGESLPWLYRGVQLAVEPGRVIAMMGPSGSGKSTLAKLLQGFYRVDEGAI